MMLVQDWVVIDGWRIRFCDILTYGIDPMGTGVMIYTRVQGVFIGAPLSVLKELDALGASEDGVAVKDRRVIA